MRFRDLPAAAKPGNLDLYPCKVLAHGFDSYQETWNVRLRDEAREAIAAARAEAEASDPRKETPASLTLGGEEWQVPPYGAKGGVLWRLDNPDMFILLRAPELEWAVSVRYRSAGLWQYGLDNLRERARLFLDQVAEPNDDDAEPVISRADYAIDMDAPFFRAEATHELARAFILARGQAKIMTVARTDYVQTYTIGSIERLQVQLYDKAAEIREASGKDWMREHWGTESESVWRAEVRMSGDWLKERSIRGHGALVSVLPELLTGALMDRRLTMPGEGRARRAPLHPLWWHAIKAVGDAPRTLMVHAFSTLAPEEFRAMMVRQVAGVVRSISVARLGDMLADDMRETTAAAIEAALTDPQVSQKIERAREFHRWTDRPR